MESYIEVSMFVQVLTIYVSIALASISSKKAIGRKQSLCYGFLISASCNIMWNSYAWIVLFLLECFCMHYFFSYAKSTYVLAYVYRIALMLTGWLCVRGSFKSGLWYVQCDYRCLYYIVACAFFLLCYEWKWSVEWMKQDYMYELKILFEDEVLCMPAYLDSGNLALYQTLPLLVLDASYESYFPQTNIQWIEVEGVNANRYCKGVKCKIQINQGRKQEVYVCFKQGLKLPCHAKALLNIHTITMG